MNKTGHTEVRRRPNKGDSVQNNNNWIQLRQMSTSMDHDEEERIQYKNITKAETVTELSSPSKLGLFTVTGAVIVLASVACEIGKQVSNYAINYYNGGTYPLPQTLLVVLLEVLKLSGTVLRMRCQTPSFDKSSVKASFKFLLPSVIYAVNNNIYLAGLILVPPPIWVILCSFRTVVTTCLYKFILKRDVTTVQFLGSFFIVLSIVVAKLGDLLSGDGGNNIPVMAIVFAVVSSFNSVGVSIYQEQLFKNSGENFLEQQFWLYLYGMGVAAVVHIVAAPSLLPGTVLDQLSVVSHNVKLFLALGLLFSSVGGLVVAAILKKLDNVVKEYSSATANMFTAVISAILFPDKFKITWFIVLAMGLLFTGIFLYERKSFNFKSQNSKSLKKEKIQDSDSQPLVERKEINDK